MSGVYIKGMEMPKNCDVCPFNVFKICLINTLQEGKYTVTHSCPLIPVPDHGRLIDADAYKAEMKKRQDACAEWRDDIKSGGGYGTELYHRADSFLGAMCEAKLTLDKMPTIIPADKEADTT